MAPLDFDSDIRHDPVVQAAGGVVAGVYISFVPAVSQWGTRIDLSRSRMDHEDPID